MPFKSEAPDVRTYSFYFLFSTHCVKYLSNKTINFRQMEKNICSPADRGEFKIPLFPIMILVFNGEHPFKNASYF